jgi:hypothetical protein
MKDNAWLGGAIAVQNSGDRMVVSGLSTWSGYTETNVIIVGFKLKAVRAEREREREISEDTRFPAFSKGDDQMIACWVITTCRVKFFLFAPKFRKNMLHLSSGCLILVKL